MEIIILILIASLAVNIWYYISLQTAMDAISARNRSMSGGLVWLTIIPIFGLIWSFIFNSAIKNSYSNEFKDLGIRERVSLVSGIIYPAMTLLFTLLNYVLPILFFGTYDYRFYYYSDEGLFFMVMAFITLITSLILWIVFWVKVVNLKNILLNHLNYDNNSRNKESRNLIDDSVRDTSRIANNNLSVNVSDAKSATLNETKKRVSATTESTIDKLKKYHNLLIEGLISQDEFDRIKKEIIDSDK